MSWVRLAAVALVALGCAKRVGTPVERGRDARAYLPLAVGNEWRYEVSSLGKKQEATIRIEKIDGPFFIDSRGAKLRADAFGVRDERRYLIQEPVKVGTTWKNVISPSSVEHYEILQAGSPCEVPAGKFPDCVMVESKNRGPENVTLVNRMTFARGVGMVRVAVTMTKPGMDEVPQHQLQLVWYKLAAPGQP
jgi:hypothetical protein